MAKSGVGERAAFSSILALVAALTLCVFTTGAFFIVSSLHWSMWLVVAWSYAISIALAVWAVRDWCNIHWIGNPTLSMVAGASGSSIAAVALAFTFASSQEQDVKAAQQMKVLDAQLRTLERIEQLLAKQASASKIAK